MADAPRPEEQPSKSLEDLVRAAYESGMTEETAGDHESLVKAVLAARGLRTHIQLPDLPGDFPASPLEPSEGEAFSRYEVHGRIARGGMGVVLKGRDRDLGREVAIKVLDRRHTSNSALVQRFIEEAQIGGQLQHPGIVPVHEMGHRPDRRPFFAMKLVKGRTLSDLLKKRKTPEEDRRRFFDIFEKVCQTMAYAHARSVVHRDLKPANIMVGAFGEVQVMDWGLSKVLGRDGESEEKGPAVEEAVRTVIETVRSGSTDTRSQVGSVMGTPMYMPPEQARGDVDAIDERSDVFALGAILSEILTGKQLYTGETVSEIRQKAQAGNLTEAFDRLDAAGLDRELDRIVRTCLSQEKTDRPRNAGVVADAFTTYLASVEERVRKAEVAAARAEARVVGERKVRNRTVLAAVSLVVAAVLITGGYLWSEKNRRVRQHQLERKVYAALDEAKEARRLAGAGGESGLVKWVEAQAAMKQAKAFAEEDGVDPDLRRRVASFSILVEQEGRAAAEAAAQTRKDRWMVERLDAIRTTRRRTDRISFDNARLDADYTAAFREYGIDVDALSLEEARTRIRKSPIVERLVTALDHWASDRKKLPGKVDSAWRLIRLTKAVDPSPLRVQVRDACFRDDLDTLKKLVTQEAVLNLSTETHRFMANGLLRHGEKRRAADLLRVSVRRHPGKPWTHYELARILGYQDSPVPEEALRHASVALALLPGNAAMWNMYSNTLEDCNRLEEAIAASRKALAINPDYVYSLINLGNTVRKKGDLDLALQLHRKAVRLEPDHAMTHFHLAVTQQERGEVDAALESYREAIRIRPDHAKAITNYGLILVRGKDYAGGLEAYKRAVRVDPHLSTAWFNLANVLNLMGRPEEALEAVLEGLRFSPRDLDLLSKHTVVLRKLGRNEEAIAVAEKTVKAAPNSADAFNSLGCSLVVVDRLDDALAAFERAIQIRPDHYLYHFNRGNVLARMENHEEALLAFREAHRLKPDHERALMLVGMMLDRLGRYREAMSCYKKTRPPKRTVALCRQRVKLLEKLRAVLDGEAQPGHILDREHFAVMCRAWGRHAASVRFWESVFEEEPEKARGWFIEFASESAAIAGCGGGEDADSLDAKERAEMRCQSVEWAWMCLDSLAAILDAGGEGNLRKARLKLLSMKNSRHFARLLEPAVLSKHPESEQIEFVACFARLEALLERCQK